MKLVKVFSDCQFKNVEFNDGFNVVLANIYDINHKKDTHNLGKTSLLIVIDFLLLSKFSKDSALLTNSVFKNQTFYLEIKLNSDKYLVIKRSISEPSKVSFKCNEVALRGFTPPSVWDEEKLPFEKSVEKLNKYLGYDVLSKWSYRKSVSYFLRTQKDYLDVFQLNKFKGKQITWKPFVFDLLGFDGSLINKKLEIDESVEAKHKEIEILQNQANIDVEERDKIVGLIDIKTQEKQKTEAEIDKFNFYAKDASVTKELIDSIDAELQSLNAERYRLGFEIKKINDSLSQPRTVVHLEKLKELYEDVSLFFPESLSKQFEELEQFTDSISSERRKYLAENLKAFNEEFDSINTMIKRKELERSEKISMLTEADVYDKFKVCQKELASVEAEVKLLQEKLRLIDNSSSIKVEIETLKDQRSKYVAQIREAIDKRAHAEINRIFNQIITDVVGTNAIISIKQNAEGNVEFEADYQTTAQVTTSEADGTSYKKLLCVAFDLALLIYYSSRSFYKFVYHDGVLEGLDNRIKVRLLNEVQKICTDHGLQYILTLIDSDIPVPSEGIPMAFSDDSVCLRLHDRDDSGKLFEISF